MTATNPRDKPLPPLADTESAKHQAVIARVFELNALDRMNTEASLRKALGEIYPEPAKLAPLSPASKVVVAFIVAVVSAVIVPLLLWVIGHGFLPLFQWGTSWI